MKTVLTIAGHDPSSGAGITADLAVFAAHGHNGTSAITALTVQSTAGVRASYPVSPDILRDTLACLDEDLPPAGVKIGMLGSAAAVDAVADYLALIRRRSSAPLVVLDPVLRSSSGRELLDHPGLLLLQTRLLPLVDWVTPNLTELAILSGTQVVGRNDLPGAGSLLQSRYATGTPLGVFATGGHLEPPDDFLLTPAGEQIWLPGRRVETRATHGTGCVLASAFLANLVHGAPAPDSARAAKGYVAGAMENAQETGSGPCAMDPLWKMRPGNTAAPRK